MEEQKGGSAAATATIEDNTFEALEKDFQEVQKRERLSFVKFPFVVHFYSDLYLNTSRKALVLL
jgi:hypothetical protein